MWIVATGNTSARFRKFRPWTFDPSLVAVEPEYSGPVITDFRNVTKSWVEGLIAYLKAQKKFHKRYLLMLIKKTEEILRSNQNVVELSVPKGGELKICGDLHGQFYDLLNVVRIHGDPGEKNYYIFNGDFIDRGSFSVEVITTLMAWKCLYPDFVHLLRGNHENKQVHKWHG